MKLALVIFALLSVTGSAFLARPMPRASSKTAVAAASGMFGPHGPRLGQESTVPVADRKVSRAEVARMKDVVLDPDYRLTIWFASLCPLILWYHPCKWPNLVTDDDLCLHVPIVTWTAGCAHKK